MKGDIMKDYKYWTEAEIEKLLREYRNKDIEVLAKEMGRSEGSITAKYYNTVKERGVKIKKKPKITNKNYRKANRCPMCGGRKINKVQTFINQCCVDVNYCIECSREFTGDGYILRPAWEGDEGVYKEVL